MPNSVTRGALYALAFFFTLAASAASPPKLLATATLDPKTHQVKVELKNTAKLPAVAWSLRITQSDVNNKVLASFNSEEDNVFAFAYPDDPEEMKTLATGFIQPGQTSTRTSVALPNAARFSATVVAVIYADRRAEGDENVITHLFDARAQDAKTMADSAASPQTSAAVRAEHADLKTPPMARAQALEAQSRRVR